MAAIDPKDFRVKPGDKVDLDGIDPEDCHPYKDNVPGAPPAAKEDTEREIARIAKFQEVLYAGQKQALLVVLQGMDTSGKDGATRAVIRDVSPQGTVVHAFKKPSSEELSHDYLWRIHERCPGRGMITVFNRSHYEDVLVVRVHSLVPEKAWSRRYDQINEFERILTEEGTSVLKLFLHISKKEQKKRLEDRLKDKTKLWKFSVGDLGERRYWEDYQKAYEDALGRCSTEHAPWYIVPSNKKWYRNAVITRIVAERLEKMDLKFPKVEFDPKRVVIE